MPIRIGDITFDCNEVLKVGGLWSEALRRPLDPGGGPAFASLGGDDPERAEPAWHFEKVPELKVAKNRTHLDWVDPDPSAVDWLVALGAPIVAQHQIRGGLHRWTVMQDP